MESRPLLLSAVLGLAALGASPSLAAQDRGYVSISIGTSVPYNDRGYHHPGYFWLQGHWVSSHGRRVWIPGQYVRAHGYRYDRGYHPAYNRGYRRGYRHDPRVIYRPGPILHPRPLPGAFYYERGGDEYERDHYRHRDPYRGW